MSPRTKLLTGAALRQAIREEIERQVGEQKGTNHVPDTGLDREQMDSGAVRDPAREGVVEGAVVSHAALICPPEEGWDYVAIPAHYHCLDCEMDFETHGDYLAHDIDSGHFAERVSKLRPEMERKPWTK